MSIYKGLFFIFLKIQALWKLVTAWLISVLKWRDPENLLYLVGCKFSLLSDCMCCMDFSANFVIDMTKDIVFLIFTNGINLKSYPNKTTYVNINSI